MTNILLGFASDFIANAAATDQIIYGTDFDDIMEGTPGADTLIGGLGNDRYTVNDVSDAVIELPGEGEDYIFSSISYTAAANTERLYLEGTDNLDATGLDGQTDLLVGNAGNNRLDGKGGADILAGGDGFDFYFVDDPGDEVIETNTAPGEIGDYIFSTVSIQIAANTERLYLKGNDNIDATGRDGQNDVLIGNDGSNTLDGKGGADVMVGGDGNDTYYIDHISDIIIEDSDGGTNDVMYTSGSYLIRENVERMIAAEGVWTTSALHGRDDQSDILVGNELRNSLYGGFGRDTLVGGAGTDYFGFNTKLDPVNNVDRINDFNPVDDQISLWRDTFSAACCGLLPETNFRAGTAALDADDLIIYDSTTGSISYDADGIGGEDQILFAYVTAGTVLTEADFQIF